MSLIFSKDELGVGDKGFIVGNRFVPINNNYGLPEDGLVFYASLNGKTPSIAETGQSLQKSGNISYEKIDGISCAYFDEHSYILSSYISGEFPSLNSICSISFLAKRFGGSSIFGYGSDSNDNHNQRKTRIQKNKIIFSDNQLTEGIDISSLNEKWHHYCFVVDLVDSNNVVYFYFDGRLLGEKLFNLYTDESGDICIGSDVWKPYNLYEAWNGYVSSVRVFNRVLNHNEIKALLNEFEI